MGSATDASYSYKERVRLDKLTETEDTLLLQTTVTTDKGTIRTYDAFVLRGGRVELLWCQKRPAVEMCRSIVVIAEFFYSCLRPKDYQTHLIICLLL